MKPLTDRFYGWASSRLGSIANPREVNSAWLEALRGEIASREKRGDAIAEAAAIGLLVVADPRSNAATLSMLDRAIGLSAGALVEATNTLRVLRLLATPYAGIKGSKAQVGKLDDSGALALLQDPAIAADALAADTLRLTVPSEPAALLQEVADDERLGAHHPLRQLALLKLANRAASKGELEAAQALFMKTGLTEQQCALIGARPGLRRSGADSSDFPQAAMMYGFEGWVNLEFDITADGRAANARPVIAYPPFVFVDAAQGMARGIRYEASYRPSGGVACSANREMIRFILP